MVLKFISRSTLSETSADGPDCARLNRCRSRIITLTLPLKLEFGQGMSISVDTHKESPACAQPLSMPRIKAIERMPEQWAAGFDHMLELQLRPI